MGLEIERTVTTVPQTAIARTRWSLTYSKPHSGKEHNYETAPPRLQFQSMAEGNSKFRVLKKSSKSLVDHFAAADLVTAVAPALFGNDLVPFDVYSHILNVADAPQVKAVKISEAVTLTVKAKPLKFVDLVEVLEKQGMQELADLLKDELSTLLFT